MGLVALDVIKLLKEGLKNLDVDQKKSKRWGGRLMVSQIFLS